MKVKIKDLKPNPFRDMKNYPINQEKIESLKNSIKQTGFWDNILARKNNGNIEIAYGHHRLVVLRELFNPDNEVDIPVKDIDDSTMIRIMANENDESWGTNPKVIDETVRVTKKYLEKNPNEIKTKRPKFSHRRDGEGYHSSPLAFQIAEFLNGNWNELRVYHSLERFGLIGKKKLDKESVERFETERQARSFVGAIKNSSKAGKKITPEQQKRASKRIKEEQDFSKAGIRRAVFEETQREKPKKEKQEEIKLYDLREEIKETEHLTEKLNTKLLNLIQFKEEIRDEVYKEEIKTLVPDINLLMQRLKNFLGGDHESKKVKGQING